MKKTAVLGMILTPALGYPLFAGVLFLHDTLVGDRLLLYQLRYEQRYLWETFWADYLQALPVFYGLSLLLLAVFLVLRRTLPLRSATWLLLLGALLGWGVGAYLTGAGWSGAVVAVTIAGIGFSALLALFVGLLQTARDV